MANLFGLTPALVAARVQGIVVGASASPSTSAFEEMLEEVAARWALEFTHTCGGTVDDIVDSGPTADLYKVCRSAIIAGCVDAYILSRDPRTAPLERPFLAEWNAKLELVRRVPQVLQANAEGPQVAISLTNYPTETAVPGLAGAIIRGGC